ncbi:transcription elongation factor GreAB [Pseudomonas protegens]|uniref:transcription elongation factor GreAB n=1 Tax=Pseudomonas protegens TaxID=380021 RepID=UPI00227FF16A|nr:transcription elongation factor GreAB [Pseudomonas protegens]MCY7261845.1 transcription elongation factor GreAB [Pseudomonas protegens]
MSTKLITQDGYDALKQELDYLWREKRPDITQKVTWAASLGDRSENADFAQAPQRNYYFERTPCPCRRA